MWKMKSSRREKIEEEAYKKGREREWRPSQAPSQPISATWWGEVSGPVPRIGIDGEIRRGRSGEGPQKRN